MAIKPSAKPTSPHPAVGLHAQGDFIWLPLRNEWRNIVGKPEEAVRQEFIRHLHIELGYELAQMGQELKTQHGTTSPRADIAVWASVADKANGKSPKLIVECKAESVAINLRDYYQGESYARSSGADFFIAHNRRFTEIFRVVPALPGQFVEVSEIPKAADWGDAKRIAEIKAGQRGFNRAEFTKLLRDSHNILRNVHKMEPWRRIRHHLQNPVHQNVRGAEGPARPLHDRLPRSARKHATGRRSSDPRPAVR